MQINKSIKQMTRYMVNSGISAITDLSIYVICVLWLQLIIPTGIAIVISVLIARILSSLINFSLNKSLFYGKNKSENRQFLIRYYKLWCAFLVLSATITYFLNDLLDINEVLAKVIADSSLGLSSFWIQRKWVFSTKNNPYKKGFYFRFVRACAKIFVKRKMLVDTKVFEKGCVMVAHHQNFYAPVCALIYMPDSVQIWAIDHLFDFKECYLKYYEFTFRQSMKLPKIISAIFAFFCAITITPLVKSAKAIPVYRGSKDVIKTFKESVSAIEDGNQILIFPDVLYDDTDDEMKEVYAGFLNLEKLSFRQNKQHLKFIPLQFSKKYKTIKSCSQVVFLDNIPFAEDKNRVKDEIVSAINTTTMI